MPSIDCGRDVDVLTLPPVQTDRRRDRRQGGDAIKLIYGTSRFGSVSGSRRRAGRNGNRRASSKLGPVSRSNGASAGSFGIHAESRYEVASWDRSRYMIEVSNDASFTLIAAYSSRRKHFRHDSHAGSLVAILDLRLARQDCARQGAD